MRHRRPFARSGALTLAAWLLLGLIAGGCGEEPPSDPEHGQSQESLDLFNTLDCEEGQIGWRFPKKAAQTHTQEYAAQAGADAVIEVQRSLRLDIQELSCGGSPASRYTLADLRENCNGQKSCWDRIFCGVGREVKVTYSCGMYDVDEDGEPRVHTASFSDPSYSDPLVELSCDAPAKDVLERESRVACIPRQCHGRARRNEDMECVVAPEKEETVVSARFVGRPRPVITTQSPRVAAVVARKIEEGVYPSEPLAYDSVYEIEVEATFAYGRMPEVATFTAWMEKEFPMTDMDWNPIEPARVFFCTPFAFDLTAEDPHTVGDKGEWIFRKKIQVNFSEECKTGGFKYRRQTDEIVARRGRYPSWYEGNHADDWTRDYLHLSYDMEGKAVWHKGLSLDDEAEFAASTPECAPNPTGFFYDAEHGVYRFSEYYEQRKITSYDVPLFFNRISNERAEIGTLDIKARDEMVIRANSSFSDPLPVDISWYASNLDDYNMKNPDGPWAASWGGRFDSDYGFAAAWPANLRADVYLLPTGLSAEERESTEPLYLASLPLKGGMDEGKTDTLMVPITKPLEAKFLTPSDSFAYVKGEMAQFDLFYCIAADKTNGGTYFQSLWTKPEQVFASPPGADDLVAPPEGDEHEFESLVVESDADLSGELPWRKRGCRVARTPLVVRVDRFTSPEEPISPFGYDGTSDNKTSGDGDMSGANDNGNQPTCADDSKLECDETNRGSNRSDGEGGRSLYDLNSESGRSRQGSAVSTGIAPPQGDVPAGPQVFADFRGEFLGYQVFDPLPASESVAQWVADNAEVPDEAKSITLGATPDWDALRATLNGTTDGTPVEWEKGRYAGKMGLGVGWGFKFRFQVGPVPVLVVVTFTVGASVGLEVKFDFAPQEEDDEYPCIDETEDCYVLSDATATFSDAVDACVGSGGRLAEPSSQAEAAALIAAAAGDPVWVGGQLAYWNDVTEYRWLSNASTFARTDPGQPMTVYGDEVFGVSTASLSTQKPNPAGIWLDPNTNQLKSSPINDNPKKFVCTYDAAGSELYLKWAFSLKTGMGAGMGLKGCVPTDNPGFCLGADMNIVATGLDPTISQTYHWLWKDGDILPFGRRGSTDISMPWHITLFEGQVSATVEFLWFTIQWVIKSFDGIKIGEGSLYDLNLPTAENWQ